VEVLLAALAVGAACALWGLILFLQRRRSSCERCDRSERCAPSDRPGGA